MGDPFVSMGNSTGDPGTSLGESWALGGDPGAPGVAYRYPWVDLGFFFGRGSEMALEGKSVFFKALKRP